MFTLRTTAPLDGWASCVPVPSNQYWHAKIGEDETARMRLTARMPVGGCIIAPDKQKRNHTELDQILL